jgi:hypothetical protein
MKRPCLLCGAIPHHPLCDSIESARASGLQNLCDADWLARQLDQAPPADLPDGSPDLVGWAERIIRAANREVLP